MVINVGAVLAEMYGSPTPIAGVANPTIAVDVVVWLLVLLGLRSAVPGGVPLAVAVGTLHFSTLSIVVVVAFVTFW